MYNPEKHHRRSVRLKNHSYNEGFYFVTICCENRSCIFGKIKDGVMTPNDYGKIAQNEWAKTVEIRNNVKLHGFVAMPNHIHGILEINNANHDSKSTERFQNQGKNTLSSIVGSYKSAVSKQIHESGFIGSVWQRNYHESVIYDAQSYQNRSQYIINNPAKWEEDEFYSDT
jgi:REP element-mobilizing transposase RayT